MVRNLIDLVAYGVSPETQKHQFFGGIPCPCNWAEDTIAGWHSTGPPDNPVCRTAWR
jgi:hypothetical protein